MKKLTNFAPPPQSKNAANKAKVERFIRMFNQKIAKGEFTLNDGLDLFTEELNDAEFELAKTQAFSNGYILTKFEDNYNTITYKLEIRD